VIFCISNFFLKGIFMRAQEIIDMALKLKPHERLQLVEKIQQSFDQNDPVIDRLWGQEALRRLEAHRRGELGAVPMEAVFGKY